MSTDSDAVTLSLTQALALAQTPPTAIDKQMPGNAAVQVAQDFEPGAIFGSYRVVGHLGEGGMGQVYQAVQGTLERLVALKVMRPELAADPQFAERFLREARAAASVCHQNVVVIFDAGDCAGRLYMAFQFVAGGDLDAVLSRRGRLPPGEALRLLAGCCDGLQAIHEAGLVHRDIKPHNIFIDAQGRPKLGDFGLARQAQGADRMTMTGVGMGTPAYMSPEQAEGLADIDIRADIHALGGTLYTMLTGQPPFTGLTPWMVVNSVCNEPAPDPRRVVPDIPEAVADIVVRCLAKRREQRYATPALLHADLQRVQGLLTGGPTPTLVQGDGSPIRSPPGLRAWHAPGQSPSALGGVDRETWRRIRMPLGMTAVALLALPLVLRPLVHLNDQVRGVGWNQASWWAGFLSELLLSAGILLVLVSARRDRLAQVVSLIVGSIIAGLAVALLGRALLATSNTSASAWESVAAFATCLAAVGFAAWHVPRWWHRDSALSGLIYPRLWSLLIAATTITVILHLAVAEHPVRNTVPDETRNAWGDFKRALSGETGSSSSTQSSMATRSNGAAEALNWLVPLTLIFIAPAVLGWRERRGILGKKI